MLLVSKNIVDDMQRDVSMHLAISIIANQTTLLGVDKFLYVSTVTTLES